MKTAPVERVIEAVEGRVAELVKVRELKGDALFYRDNPEINSVMEQCYRDLEALKAMKPGSRVDVSYKSDGSGWCEYFGDYFGGRQIEAVSLEDVFGRLR